MRSNNKVFSFGDWPAFWIFSELKWFETRRPLYPIYLFVLVMDALSILLRRAEEAGFILVSMIGGGGGEGVEISHLLVWNLAHIN